MYLNDQQCPFSNILKTFKIYENFYSTRFSKAVCYMAYIAGLNFACVKMLGCTLKVRFSLFFNPDFKITLSPLRDRRHDQTVSPQHAGRSTCDKPLKIIPRTEMPIMFSRDSTLCQLTEARKVKRINLSAT